VSDVHRWLEDPSLVISVASLVVSTAISAKALKVARRSAPDVYGQFEVFEKADDAPDDAAPVAIYITARNRGLASVNIEDFEMVNGDGRGHFRWRFRLDETCELSEGPPLPTTMKNGSKITWLYYVRQLKFRWRDKVITEPREIYKALSLPYLEVDFEDGSQVVFRNRDGRYIAWLYGTWQDWKAKRHQRALRAARSSDDSAAGDDAVSS
jgi:hypothetical protein